MNLEVASRNRLEIAASRLELEYADWQGGWEEFVVAIKKRAHVDELEVLDVCAREFRAHAIARRRRIREWEDNRILGLFENMHSLAINATKNTGKNKIPDNNVRLQATKFLLEHALRIEPEKTSGTGSSTEADQDQKNVGEMEDREAVIKEELEKRGGKITEKTTTVERSLEVGGAAQE